MLTGGKYSTRSSKFDSLNSYFNKIVGNGFGGDTPENDVEAFVSAQERFSHAEAIIRIADNYSTMRDFEFIKEIKIPVHVILCDYENYINPEYLRMAKLTKGSIITNEFDLNKLDLKPDCTFRFKQIAFKWKKLKFKP
jgi:hypothetical protein